MRTLCLAFLLCLLAWSPTWADGLVYQLPEDGEFVRFDLELTEIRDGNAMTEGGSITMASVGQKEVDGKKCRWIEFKLVLSGKREQDSLIKVLVPEQFLKAGASPVEHIVKGWYGRPGRDAKPIEGDKNKHLGPVAAFLCGPLKDVNKLVAEDIETKLGKLSCPGVTGMATIKGKDTTAEVLFNNRLSDKAPFGVVTSHMKLKTTRSNGQVRDHTLTLKLAEVGKMAKSEIPD